jgi:His-Xaa-Ser system protein HxsD
VEAAATVTVDSHIYSKEAILQACYWFTDRAYVLISRDTEERYLVSLQPKADHPTDAERLAGEFANALIDSQLRQQITEETSKIRELIFAKAFSEGGLLDDPPPGDDRDPVEIRGASEARDTGNGTV